jgi:hypothetical protein
VFDIRHGSSITHLPDATGNNWEDPDLQLEGLIAPDTDADFTVAIVNAPIERNYYMRRLGDNLAVISLFEMADILKGNHFKPETFVLRNIYVLIALYFGNNRTIPISFLTWAHDDVRGCLFDMNANKQDIVFSMHRPTLCHDCRNRMLNAQIDPGVLPALDQELRRLTKDLFFRINDWVQEHPLWSLAIAAAAALALNVLANVLYDVVKGAISR